MKDLSKKLELEDAQVLEELAISDADGGSDSSFHQTYQSEVLGQIRDLLVELVNEARTARAYGHGLPWPEHCAEHAKTVGEGGDA